MANNRLWLRHPNGAEILIAKSWGTGWEFWGTDDYRDRWSRFFDFDCEDEPAGFDVEHETRLYLETEYTGGGL